MGFSCLAKLLHYAGRGILVQGSVSLYLGWTWRWGSLTLIVFACVLKTSGSFKIEKIRNTQNFLEKLNKRNKTKNIKHMQNDVFKEFVYVCVNLCEKFFYLKNIDLLGKTFTDFNCFNVSFFFTLGYV